MAETDKLLKTVLVMQAEILGRLEALEKAAGTDKNPRIDPRFDALAQLDSLMDTDLGASLRSDIDDLVDKVNGAR